MTPGNAKAIRISGAVLVGGLATGMLLAMAMPTEMKRKSETWRDLLGLQRTVSDDDMVPVYAPPEDLTPVQWQSAADEYPGSNRANALDRIYADQQATQLSGPSDAVSLPDREQDQEPEIGHPMGDDVAAQSAQAADAVASEVTVVQQEPAPAAIAPAVIAVPVT